MIKKVLVMNSYEESGQTKGLLSLECHETLIGHLRLFGVKDNIFLVLKIGENSLVFEDIKEPENFSFNTIYHSLDLPICAIAISQNKIVAYAKTENYNGNCYDLLQEKEKYERSLIEDVYQQGLENELDEQHCDNNELCEDINISNIKSCKNDETQRENMNDKKSLEEPIEFVDNFFNMIKPQIDELFSKFGHYIELESKIAGTEWAKVPYINEKNDHYIIGKILDDGVVTHICYGVPATSMDELPTENLRKYSQWLPIIEQNSIGKERNVQINDNEYNSENNVVGYWVMYQDAITGENIEM